MTVTVRQGALKKGAQPGNTNGLRHGLRSGSVRLALGKLPREMVRIERAVNQFRLLIEAAVVEAHGQISVYHAALIQSACRHETHSMMAKRWLRLQDECLDHNQRLAYSKAIADASTARDKCLEKLGLQPGGAGDAYDDYLAGRGEPLAIEDQTEEGNENRHE
ncbi:MAG TPA: hypothetical protein VFE62_12300 [Gemmataceae bacterium]|nr:hypothetical protein [Pirellulales bacterium]HZZ79294.1 hypothetical protein [Gemmataceae bacterium]